MMNSELLLNIWGSGIIFKVINIFLLISLFFVINSTIKFFYLRLSLSIIFGFTAFLQITSVYFTGDLVGFESFFRYNTLKLSNVVTLVKPTVILLLLIFVGLTTLFFFSRRIFNSILNFQLKFKIKTKRNFTRLVIFAFSVIGLSIKGGIFLNGYELYTIVAADDKFFQETGSSSKFKNDTNRFIAHAGGGIEGYTYTNSLEALNFNYAKGFKLFELDFIKTSDNQYVAAHDWEHWAKAVNFSGILPVTHEEFLRHKIYGKYTPMDIKKVNEWFNKNCDAILVTDKVNQPKEFSDLFLSNDRLIMELFSLEAVKEGLEIGLLSSMPSQNVIRNLEGNKIDKLKELGVRHIAVSQRFMESNRSFFIKLKINHIRTFVYNINYDGGKDEEYFIKHEKNFIYGLYADKWNFAGPSGNSDVNFSKSQ